MSESFDPSRYILGNKKQGIKLTPNAMSLIIDPTLTPAIGLGLSQFVGAHPLAAFVLYGTLRNYIIVLYNGVYFYANWDRHKTLKDFADGLKEFTVEQDTTDRFRVLGFTPELYNFQEYDNISLFKMTNKLNPGAHRLLVIEKEKTIATPTQYRVCGDLTEGLEFETTDSPLRIKVKIKPGVDIMKFFWEKETPYA